MTPAERLLDRLEGTKATGDRRWQARCPGHDDRTPSLSVTEKANGDALVYCHAGCPVDEVLEALGLAKGDLFAERRNVHREILATYPYTDESGELLFEVVRREPKDFRQRQPDGVGGWTWSLNGTRRVLYRLPRVLEAASRGEGVFIVEGEKDVEALNRIGVLATCNPGGAGKWRTEYAEALRGAQAIVVADRDEAGRDHARQVASSLDGVAATVDVVEPAKGKDVADHLAAGLGIGALRSVDSFLSSTKGSGLLERNDEGQGLPFAVLGAALAAAPSEPEWHWSGYLAPGVVTLLAGRPKVGKSTMLFALLVALTTGRPFLGRETRRTGVLLLSEERESSLAEKMRRFGLESEAVHLLMRHQVRDEDWPQVVEQAGAYCKTHGLGTLIVDTFDKWTGLRGEQENNTGDVLGALAPLVQAAGDGLSVLVVAHHRKSGGSHGDAVKGSNALIGGVDVVVELDRAPSDVQTTGSTRVLRSLSRFAGTPEELTAELGEDGYEAHGGDLGALRLEVEMESVRDALAADEPSTISEVASRVEGLSEQTTRRRLEELHDRAEVERHGAGKRGDPYRFVLSFQHPESLGDGKQLEGQGL